MIANMNEKGRQVKLLAAIAVLAMVVCAFAVVMPSEDVSADVPSTPTSFNGDIDTVSGLNLSTAQSGSNYRIDSDLVLTNNTTVNIPAGVSVWIVNGGSITIPSGYTTDNFTLNGTIYVMSTGEYIDNTYFGMAFGEKGKITVVGGTLSVQDDDANIVLVGSSGLFTPSTTGYVDVQSVTVEDSTGTNYTIHGAVTANAGGIWQNDKLTVADDGSLTVDAVPSGLTGDDEENLGFYLSGALDNNGTITVNNGRLMTLGDYGVTSTNDGTMSIAGTVASNGSSSKITNNGTINFSGSGTAERDVFGNTNGINAFANSTTFGTYSAIVGEGPFTTGNLSVFGSMNQDVSIASSAMFYIGSNSSYSGTVTYTVGNELTYTVTLTATSSSTAQRLVEYNTTNGLVVAGQMASLSSGNQTYPSSSSVTVTALNAVDENTTEGNTYDPVVTLDGVAINGSISAEITAGANGIVIPAGAVMTFMSGTTIDLGSYGMTVLGDLRYGNGVTVNNQIDNSAGYVYTNDRSMVTPYTSDDSTTHVILISGSVLVDYNSSAGFFTDTTDVAGNTEKFLNLVNSGVSFELGDDLVINILTSVTIGNTTVYIPGGSLIVVGEIADNEYSDKTIIEIGTGTRGTLTLNGTTVYSYGLSDTGAAENEADGTDSIVIKERNGLNITNGYVYAVVDVDSRASSNINNRVVDYTNNTDNVMVGFGTILNLSGTVNGNVTVYGDIVINSDVDIPYGSELNAYKGSSVTVNGTLDIAGQANLFDGSSMTINGTATVYRDVGGAVMTVGIDPTAHSTDENTRTSVTGANLTVASEGGLSIESVRSNYAGENSLIVNNKIASYNGSWSARVLIQGTLEIDGTLSGGYVYDMGTVTFDGKATNSPTIVLGDGISVTVSSVAGTMNFTDAGIADENVYNRESTRDESTGNIVTIDDVRNITVSAELNESRWTDDDDNNHIDYYSVMRVSGSVTSTDDDADMVSGGYYSTIRFSSPAATSTFTGVGEDDDILAYIEVAETLNLGRNIQLTVSQGETVISGELTAMSQESNNGGEPSEIVNSNGEITVTGHMYGYEGYITPGNINAAFYQVTGTGEDSDTVDHYTGFNAAVAAGLEADDDLVYIYGTVNATETIDIPAGLQVTMNTGATLNVPADVTVTLVNGAEIEGLSATIDVDGTFIAENVVDMTVTTVISDVVIDETPRMTWTSLANAIDMGMTEITLNGPLHITEDLTIPKGVTVSTNYEVDVDLTAAQSYAIWVDEATLTVDGALSMGEMTEGRIIFSDTDSKMIVNGQFVARLMGVDIDVATNPDIYNIAGAHYQITDGAYDIFYISSIEIAAENVSGEENLDGPVVIKGVLTSGDVTFAGTADEMLQISIVSLGEDPEDVTVLRLGTVTIENATVTIGTDCRVTGTFQSATATIDLTNAGNVSFMTTDGEEPITEIYGTFTGSVNISAGEASIDSGEELVVGADSEFIVASGATFNVPANTYIQVANSDEDNAVIDGTINFEPANGLQGTGELLVNGTANVEAFTLSTDLRVTGQLNVASGYAMTLNGGDLFLGEKPETLGQSNTGSVTGAVNFTPGSRSAIVAYSGSDVSGAQIQVNSATGESEAASTTYYVNGQAYMTVYSYDGEYDIAGASTVDGPIDLTGWKDVSNWYSVENYNVNTDTNVDSDDLGEYASVYTTLAADTVEGTVSKDAGIILTIDGVIVFSDGAWSQNDYPLTIGTHTIGWSERTGYNIENVTVTFNGQAVENGGTITITADMESFTLVAEGAVPGAAPGGDTSSDDGMGLTDYLLIVLVVLIVIMAIMVALRLMRS